MRIVRKLEDVRQALDVIAAQTNVSQFLDNAENAQKLNDLMDDIREAMTDYQVCTYKGLALVPSNCCLRLPYNGISITTPVS